jgi:spore maturation protein CgeB
MKIAFYGSSLLSSYWNGAATYYRGVLSDLARRGYAITFYEPDAFDRQKHRDIDPPPYADVRVYPATEEAVRGVVA